MIRRGQGGFSLLEMMVAMAILSGALTWLVVGMARNIRAENHAKLMTTATFLARGKMVDTEDDLYEQGFGEFDKELAGGFENRGFKRFTWRVVVDKVELPSTDQLQTVLTKAQEAKQTLGGGSDSESPSPPPSPGGASPIGAGAGAMASQFGIIKEVLEQGIRRVTVRVSWKEGKKPEEVAVVAYYTDPRKVDQAIQLQIPTSLGGAGGGAPAAPTGGTAPATVK